MSDWITDRLPGVLDTDVHGSVLVPAGGPSVRAFLWENTATIKVGDPWMPAPPPYVPPKTRDELVQELLDAIDTIHAKPRSSWTADVLESRGKLK